MKKTLNEKKGRDPNEEKARHALNKENPGNSMVI